MKIFFSFYLMALPVGLARAAINTTFLAKYGPTPKPFEIEVVPLFEDYITQRASSTRYVADDLGVPAFVDGPSLSNATAVGEFWSRQYNWTSEQDRINTL